jgi:serine/threonine-protein kinase
MGEAGREVTVARGFYLDRTEVTVRAYEACAQKRLCGAADHVTLPAGYVDRWTAPAEGDAAAAPPDYAETLTRRCNAGRDARDNPINCVDFAGAEAYCRFVGRRLPTEAEWEYAARGAEGRAYAWGSEAPACGRACFGKSGACEDRLQETATCAAGARPADRTPEGVFDLAGNVSEWVSDGEKGASRVARGGSFIDEAPELRATFRAVVPASVAHIAIGFRCAQDGPPPKP